MTVRTKRQSGVPCSGDLRAHASLSIHSPGHGFQMIRVNATAHPAKMIEIQALGDWPTNQFIQDPMSCPGMFHPGHINPAIAVPGYGPHPEPTTGIRFRHRVREHQVTNGCLRYSRPQWASQQALFIKTPRAVSRPDGSLCHVPFSARLPREKLSQAVFPGLGTADAWPGIWNTRIGHQNGRTSAADNG